MTTDQLELPVFKPAPEQKDIERFVEIFARQHGLDDRSADQVTDRLVRPQMSR